MKANKYRNRWDNRSTIGTAFFLALTLMISSTANAHPGHGVVTNPVAGQSLTHYLFEPTHLLWMLVATAVAITGILWTRNIKAAAR